MYREIAAVCIGTVLVTMVLFVSRSALAAVSQEAHRYMDRGQAAVELAKTNADLEGAVKEFQKAIDVAPGWPDPYYQLGVAQGRLGRLDDALKSLKKYLQIAPNAKDAQNARQFVNKIEYAREKEAGLKKVYAMMLERTTIVQWVRISRNGDGAPDWEIAHNEDFDRYAPPENRNQALFKMKDGALYKTGYSVEPVRSSYITPRLDGKGAGHVKVDGRYFEYKYPISLVWVVEHNPSTSPVYNIKEGGELSIKGEIVAFDPPRVKRIQRIKFPDGRITETEFVYELRNK